MTLGSLFSGYGGLDLAVHQVFGDVETAWVSDIEPGPCKVLAHRFPGVQNLGDITKVDWHRVPQVDLVCGGSPCQDISTAGRLAGMTVGTRSNLWAEMREAIRILRPRYVIWENVRGALSARADSSLELGPRRVGGQHRGPALRALGRVLGDLADLRYDAIWYGLRAADVGAPHGRFRIFLLAADTECGTGNEWGQPTAGQEAGGRALGATPRRDRAPVTLLPTPTTQDAANTAGLEGGPGAEVGRCGEGRGYGCSAWHQYAPAVHRWEIRIGRLAPAPTKSGRKGRLKLNPVAVEWMMGAPPGWITNTPGVTDNEALRMAGNGVVRQQAEAALRLMLNRMETAS